MIPSTSVSKLGRKEIEFAKYVAECDRKIASLDFEIAILINFANPLNRGERSNIQRLRLASNDPNKAELERLRA